MRHRMAGRNFSRPTDHRMAMLRNLVVSVLTSEKIVTTEPKAKEIRGLVDQVITLAKKGDNVSQRRAISLIHNEEAVKKAFKELAPRFASRNGGYTRVLKLGYRVGDGAPTARLELLS